MMVVAAAERERRHGLTPATPAEAEPRPWYEGTHGMDRALPPDLFKQRLELALASREIVWLFDPHALQQEILDAEERFLAPACGRQVGKTMTAIRWAVEEANRTQGLVWWAAPTYAAAMRGWGDMMRYLPRRYRTVVKSERRIDLVGGGSVQFVSADNPDALRGETLSGLVVDEAAYVADYVYHDVLMPMLAVTLGRVLAISTPKRKRGWFYDLWRRGRGGEEDVRSWQASSDRNPYIPALEIERLRRELPEMVFRREILAEFIDAVNAVFPRVREVATATPLAAPLAAGERVVGVDWGRYNDFTVITLFELQPTGRWRQVMMDRFTGLKFRDQVDRVRQAWRVWSPRVMRAETNSFGLPLVEELQAEGLPIEGVTTTTASKPDMVRQFQLAVEQGWVELLCDPTLIGEFEDYEEEDSPTGKPVFSAPERKHDDIVMSCVMAGGAMWGDPGGARAGRFEGDLDEYAIRGTEVPGLGAWVFGRGV
ncbi:MAG: hypothetical protein HXY24_11720 [Rubrivivax sp.]|nr:hypothetical protein [Rubrivivax sp.]